jgi:CelD/BcsL family acetyltransferase involved in cellulose biosynthesis
MSWSVVPAAGFGQHAARWRELHGASAGSPLLAADFVEALLAVFGTGREVLAWHEHGGQLDAMAILAPSRAGIWHTFQPSQAPVGLWLQRGAEAPAGLLRPLLHKLPGPGLVLGLTQCDPMLMQRPANSATVRTLDYIQTARITINGAGGFDAYWEARGKNLRNNLKKQRNRLRQDGIETRLEICREPHQMAQAVADYGRLEGSGWKAAGGTAVDAGNAQGRFYRAMLKAFAARGAASVYRYWLGSELAAMDLCVEGGGCIVVLKTAYDESMARQLSPALLMREEACRGLFEEGRFERIEFYGRIMEWHLRWTDEVRTMYHLNSYRWPGLAQLHALARVKERETEGKKTEAA